MADNEGRTSMLDLLDLMLRAEWKSKRTIKLTAPPNEILILPGAPVEKWISPPTVKLIYPQAEVHEQYWRWSGNLQNPTLTLGTAMLEQLRNAFETGARYGDFCVHVEGQKQHGFEFEKMSIWFWPA